MNNRAVEGRAANSILLFLFLYGSTFGLVTASEVSIVARSQPIEVETESYAASIASDGCLTQLRIRGAEFFDSSVSISRGTYFFLGAALAMDEVTRFPDRVEAVSDLARVTYTFQRDTMQWQLQNRSNQSMVFFLVLSEQIDSVAGPDGQPRLPGVEANWNQITCYRASEKLELEGCDRVWGPWLGSHQVVQVSLDANETRELKLRVGTASEAERDTIANFFSTKASPDPPIVLHSPREYQVFQRNTQLDGPALLSGRIHEMNDRAEYRFIGKPRNGTLNDSWQSLPLSDNGRFNLALRLPAGGWYHLDIRAFEEDKLIAQHHLEHVGIGEVFVGAGQSNSTNSGELKTKQSSGMVAAFDGTSWQLADDPLPGVADRSQGGSFWPAFGDAMHERFEVPIGIASTGFGGTSIAQWQPDTDLFQGMTRRLGQLGRNGFRALLWHQGESDCETLGPVYFSRLKKTISASRSEAGWEFPWMVAQATYHNAERPAFDQIRKAQAQAWQEGLAIQGPDTDQLTGDHRDLGGKGIHFSPKGLRAHGLLWAELVGDFVEEELKPSGVTNDK